MGEEHEPKTSFKTILEVVKTLGKEVLNRTKTANGTAIGRPVTPPNLPRPNSHTVLVGEAFNSAELNDSSEPGSTYSRIPSASGLPSTWTETQDRFIAYLSVYGPVDSLGNPVPDYEYGYSVGDIIKLLRQKFPDLNNVRLPESIIDNRLMWLELQDNDYFAQPRGAYRDTEWGRDI